MATVSGALLYDSARAGVSSPSMPGISGVPIVLQNTTTNAMLAVLTDANGRYTFLNVPNGTYRIVEAYGTPAGTSPGDFSQAQTGTPAVAATPPISFAPSASPAANRLDATTPNPLNTTVSGADITGQDILNGPVEVPADISVVKDPDIEIASIGEQVVYELAITNNGPGIARNIVLTDQVPSSLQNPEYSTNGTTWNTWNGEFRRDAMASGTTYYVLIRGTVAPTAGNTIRNTAAVTASTIDPDSTNNSSTSDLPVDSVANLGITKRADRTSVRPGETIVYTITTTNSGPGEARGVTVTDNIPLTLQNAEYSVNNGASWQPWNGSMSLGTMANGASSSMLLRAVVSPTATGSVGNTARVDSFTPDPFSGNTRSYTEVPISTSAEPSADLSLTKQASQITVRPGDTLTYTLTVRNGGPDAADAVVLTDAVPPMLTNPQYSADNDASWQPWNGSLALGTMASGASSVTLLRGVVASSASGSISNTASISSATTDSTPDNNRASLQTTVQVPTPPSADLSVTKQASQSMVHPGDTLTYTLTARNNGPNAAASVVLTDAVPSALQNTEFSQNNGASWQPWNGSLNLGTMANGTSSTTLLRGVVSSTASGSISNTASVSSATADPTPGNNNATLQTSVEIPRQSSAELSLIKQANQSSVRPGDMLTYTLTVRNGGPDAADSVVLTDNVPSALQNAEYSVNNGASWQPWNGSLALGTIANGASSDTLLRAVVASSASGSISNTASVSSATADPTSGNNNATLQTTVEVPQPPPPPPPPSADLSLSKQADKSTVRPGDTINYTLAIRNGGPDAADSVVLTDNVPSALTNAEFSADNGASWRPWNGSLALGTIANGAFSNTLLRTVVSATATGSISNTASVSSATADPASGNNSATLQTTVEPPQPPPPDTPATEPRITLKKTACPCTASPSCGILFTIKIANTGTAEAIDVVLTEALPKELYQIRYYLGNSWQSWPGKISLGTIPAGDTKKILLHAAVGSFATSSLSTLTTISYTAPGKGSYTEQKACTVPVMRRGCR